MKSDYLKTLFSFTEYCDFILKISNEFAPLRIGQMLCHEVQTRKTKGKLKNMNKYI